MEMLQEKHEGYMAHLAAMKNKKDPAKIAALLKECDKFFVREPLLGFASKGADQWRYQLASSYSDEFISKGGNYLRLYFICLAGRGRWAEKQVPPRLCVKGVEAKARRHPEPPWMGMR